MLKDRRHIYMIGIKGVGMTMLAQFLASRGNIVSGSDVKDTFLTDKVLANLKIKVFSPFSKKNLPKNLDLIIYSSAFNSKNNPELSFIENSQLYNNTRILSYAEALGEIFNQQKGIAICGSHGKTTVSAWLGYILWKADKSPNVLVGSSVPQFKGSGISGDSKLLIAEVDEYQNKLRHFQPQGVILNNIEYDHPDFFKTELDYIKVFSDFIKKIPSDGFLIVNNRDVSSRQLSRNKPFKVISFDVNNEGYQGQIVNYLAYNIRLKNGAQVFQVNNLGDFKIKLWGQHNIYNALAVIAAARELKVPISKIKKYLFAFNGTARRAEILGLYKKSLIIDDYAHHPTEVKTTLAGIKARYPNKKLTVVFHPHTFTRTKALFCDFVSSFNLVDQLLILDIYGSAREKQGGTSSLKLVQAIKAYNKKNNINQIVLNVKNITEATTYLQSKNKLEGIILLMGAGDVFRVGERLLKSITMKSKRYDKSRKK